MPSKSVKTAGDWVFAWQCTVIATQFAFPHRERELAKYTEYILRLFGSKRISAHTHIIDMDKAVQRYIAESNDLELSNIAALHHFESCYLNPNGMHYDYEGVKLADTLIGMQTNLAASTMRTGATVPTAD